MSAEKLLSSYIFETISNQRRNIRLTLPEIFIKNKILFQFLLRLHGPSLKYFQDFGLNSLKI